MYFASFLVSNRNNTGINKIKLRLYFILLLALLQFPVLSQDWNLQNNYTTYPGNVGVGMDSTSIPRGVLDMISNTNKAELFIKGAGSAPVNAGIVLQATNSTNTRSTGIFMHDELGQNEWYMGRPYKNSDRFVIFRNPGQTTHTHWSSGLRDGGNNPTGVSAMMAILANGKTGIGMDLPEAKLDIKSSGTLGARFDPSNAYLRIGDGTIDMLLDGNEITSNHLLALGSAYGQDISFRNIDATSHEHLMTIKSDGNVGIGTTTPNSRIEATSENSDSDVILARFIHRANSTEAGAGIQLGGVNDDRGFGAKILGYSNPSASYDSRMSIFTSSGLNTWNLGLTQDKDGNVGVGTTNPSAKLDIKDGVVKAGTSNATHGTVQFAGNYVGNNALNTYGSQYSSGATSIGYGVQQKYGSQGIVSSVENSSFKRGMLILDDEFKFLNAGLSTVPIGNDIAMVTRFMIKEDGNVGIGTNSPSRKLHVDGEVRVEKNIGQITSGNYWNSGNHSLELYGTGGSDIVLSFHRGGYDAGVIKFAEKDGVTGLTLSANDAVNDNQLFLKRDGRIGIGTTSPDQKLTVAGAINAEELILEDVDGADFVFEEDYDLRSLEETEQFIKANKHLPEIPSAAEMAEEGLEIKTMNILLLQKVEELTLHLISQEKEMAAQSNKISEQSARITAQAKKMEKMQRELTAIMAIQSNK